MATPGLRFVLDAEVANFDREIQQSSRRVQAEIGKMNVAARTLDTRLASVGRSAQPQFRQFGNIAQQAGFQVGDFATQIASGQNAMVAFTQQGTQLLSFFGPWGAIIGAAGAVVGALAIALWDTEDASSAAGDALDNLRSSTGGVQSALSDVIDAAEAYRDAIAATGSAQAAASDVIVAQTKREFDAKRSLLELEVKRAKAARDVAAAQIGQLQGQIDAGPDLVPDAADPNLSLTERMIGSSFAISGDAVNAQRTAEFEANAEAIRDQIKELGAEADLSAIAIERMEAALATGFKDPGGSRGAGRSGGGGRSSREREDQFPDAVEDVQAMIAAMRQELAVVGEASAAHDALRISLSAERLERRLLEEAQADGSAVSDEERQTIDDLVRTYKELALATMEAKDAAEQHRESQEQVKADIDKLEDSATSALTGLIDGTMKWNDALLQVLSTILEIARQNLLDMNAGGSGGLLGSIIKGVVGGIAGGVAGGAFGGFGAGSFTTAAGFGAQSIGGAASAANAAGSGLFSGGSIALPFAKGGAFAGGREITAFANGGVVSGPTLFPMANGMGLMGEAGPEAIMPLTRGPDGKLGVRAQGGAGAMTVNVNVYGVTDPAGFKRSEGQIRAQAARMLKRDDVRNN